MGIIQTSGALEIMKSSILGIALKSIKIVCLYEIIMRNKMCPCIHCVKVADSISNIFGYIRYLKSSLEVSNVLMES